jgi:hypothetical protein
MHIDDWCADVIAIFPNALIDTEDDGTLRIFPGFQLVEDQVVPFEY